MTDVRGLETLEDIEVSVSAVEAAQANAVACGARAFRQGIVAVLKALC
jgi:hypothetical protein